VLHDIPAQRRAVRRPGFRHRQLAWSAAKGWIDSHARTRLAARMFRWTYCDRTASRGGMSRPAIAVRLFRPAHRTEWVALTRRKNNGIRCIQIDVFSGSSIRGHGSPIRRPARGVAVFFSPSLPERRCRRHRCVVLRVNSRPRDPPMAHRESRVPGHRWTTFDRRGSPHPEVGPAPCAGRALGPCWEIVGRWWPPPVVNPDLPL